MDEKIGNNEANIDKLKSKRFMQLLSVRGPSVFGQVLTPVYQFVSCITGFVRGFCSLRIGSTTCD